MITVVQSQSTGAAKFQLNQVITQSIRLLIQYAAVLVVLVALIYWLPTTVFGYLAGPLLRELAPQANDVKWFQVGRVALGAWTGEVLAFAAALVVLSPKTTFGEILGLALRRIAATSPRTFLLAFIFQGSAVIYSTLLPSGTAESAHSWLDQSAAFAMVGLTIGAFVAVGVAAPVLAMEQRSLAKTLVRAFQLMSGHRWSFVALWLIYSMGALVVGLVLQSVLSPALQISQILKSAGQFADGVSLVVWAVLAAASYRELTRIKDGWRPEEVAEVFD